MNRIVLFFLLAIAQNTFAQKFFEGPSKGFVVGAVEVSTSNFEDSKITYDARIKVIEHFKPTLLKNKNELKKSDVNSNLLIIDESLSSDNPSIVFEKFNGLDDLNVYIPPDPYIASGPNHLIQVDNSRFRITDKYGKSIKTIIAKDWFNSVLSNISPFDPKVIYDQFAKRWVMVWLELDYVLSESYFLISVSDDENPLGIWKNWAVPSNFHGSTPVGEWSDYQGVGFDDKAIYLTANQYSFSDEPTYHGSKIRIIDKEHLYSNSITDTLYYTDIWDILYFSGAPDSVKAFGLRPTRFQTADDKYYFATTSPNEFASTIGIYELTNSLTEPKLESYTIECEPYWYPNNPEQKGVGNVALDGGGFFIRNEPIFQNGSLYLTHQVATDAGSAVRFIELDLGTKDIIRDLRFARNNSYSFYPALSVTSDGSVFLTYSGSSSNEFVNSYYSYIPTANNTSVNSSVLDFGIDHYEKTKGSDRNRWGDYMGAWTDPVDPKIVWVMTQYTKAENTWGNSVAGIRTEPFAEPYINVLEKSIDFGTIEQFPNSDTLSLSIVNFGYLDLVISDIITDNNNFSVLNFSKSESVKSLDTLVVDVSFSPADFGDIEGNLTIFNNSFNLPEFTIQLKGNGLKKVEKNIFYASSGNSNNYEGILYKLDTTNINLDFIGQSEFSPLKSLTINPNNNSLYAIEESPFQETKLIMLSTFDGSSRLVTTIDTQMETIVFNETGELFGFARDNTFREINVNDGTTIIISDIGFRTSSAAYQIISDKIFLAKYGTDEIYSLKSDGSELQLIINTGLENPMLAMAFGGNNKMYGTSGSSSRYSELVEINPNDASIKSLGELNAKNIVGLAFAFEGTVDVSQKDEIIKGFKLSQNYPNPFNTTTMINFSIPFQEVETNLTIYNILGKKITTLVNETKSPGKYSAIFDASKLPSGIYFYTLTAGSFISTQKMIYLK